MANVYRSKLFGVEGFVKDVAIKVILPHWSGNPEFVRMLIDEAKVLLYLTHANIVQVFELNRHDDTYYLVMEYVDGVDMRALSKRLGEAGREFPAPLVSYVAGQIINGLNYAHEKKDRTGETLGIVHRDVSPQNVLISYEGEVKITDFGIAKIVGKTSETVTGTLKGKFAYMSPEQALGQKVDPRTDIFSMGILLFEMATGERCFKGDTDLETLEAVRTARVSFPLVSHERIPQRLRDIILKALKKNREERYQSTAEFRSDLRTFEREAGHQAGAGDLKNFLADLFAERIARKKKEEEDLSQKTKIVLRKAAEETRSHREKTKVLVGDTRVLAGADADKTIISVVRTVIEAIPATVIDVVSKVSHISKRPLRPVFFAGGVAAALLVVFLVLLFRPSGRMQPPIGPVAPHKTVVTAPPVIVEPPPVPAALGQRLLAGYALPKVLPVVPATPKEAETPKKPVTYGGLTVTAMPWGTVSIGGMKGTADPHFSRKNIPVGDYTLFVSLQRKSVSARIRIRENSMVRCTASFAESARISCH